MIDTSAANLKDGKASPPITIESSETSESSETPKPHYGRGHPKNKKTVKKAAKTTKASKAKQTNKLAPKTTPKTAPANILVPPKIEPIKVKKISKLANVNPTVSPDSPAYVVTESGVVSKGKMVRGSDMDIQDQSLIQASLDAAKQMDDEARAYEETPPIDESKLPVSERMGNTVTIGGSKDAQTQKAKMSRSAVPTSTPNWVDPFIDRDDPKPKDVSGAFIDKEEVEEKDDRFIE